jgi:hypothetical protein
VPGSCSVSVVVVVVISVLLVMGAPTHLVEASMKQYPRKDEASTIRVARLVMGRPPRRPAERDCLRLLGDLREDSCEGFRPWRDPGGGPT